MNPLSILTLPTHSCLEITGLAVAIDKNLSVIVKVWDGPVTDNNLIQNIHCDVKIVGVIEGVNGKAGVLRALRCKQIR